MTNHTPVRVAVSTGQPRYRQVELGRRRLNGCGAIRRDRATSILRTDAALGVTKALLPGIVGSATPTDPTPEQQRGRSTHAGTR